MEGLANLTFFRHLFLDKTNHILNPLTAKVIEVVSISKVGTQSSIELSPHPLPVTRILCEEVEDPL